MNTTGFMPRHAFVVPIFLSAVMVFCEGAIAQNVTLISGNSASSEIFVAEIDPDLTDQITVINSGADQSDRVSPRSFVLFPSLTYQDATPGLPGGLVEDAASVQLLVADTLDDSIWRYRPPTDGGGVWTADQLPVWSDSIGPVGPDGMSLGPGFVSVLSATQNVSPGIFLLPLIEPAGDESVLETRFGDPLLVDNDFSLATGVALNVQAVEESLASPVTVGPIDFGDLLVAVSDRPMILRYPVDQLTALLEGGVAENTIAPTVMLDESDLGTAAISGLAFWPVDNSLLVAQSGGNVLWFDYDESLSDWVPHDPALFTADQGQGKFRIRAMYFGGEPFAVMANNRGELLVYAPPGSGSNDPVKRITDGVQSPHGLVVSDLVAASAACLEEGCDLLGGGEFPVFIHRYLGAESTITGGLTERTCRVAVDPRRLDDGYCTSSDADLYLDEVCPAFATDPEKLPLGADPEDFRVRIPWQICGVVDFGANGAFDDPDDSTVSIANRDIHHGFAVVEASLTNYTQVTDQMFAQLYPAGLLGPDVDLPCRTREAIGWAAIPGEEEPIAAGYTAIDIIGGCNSPGRTSGRSLSYWFLAETGLPDLGDPLVDPVKKVAQWPVWRQSLADQFSLVGAEIDQARADLAPLVTAASASFDNIESCLARAERDALRGQRRALTSAASRIVDCDEFVELFETQIGFAQTPRNSYGAIRMLLLHLYFVIQQRMLDQPPDPSAFSGFYAPPPASSP